MNDVDILSEHHQHHPSFDSLENDDLILISIPHLIEPIIIHGTGHITVFALNNKFNEEYPHGLIYKVSRDEYEQTIKRINMILKKTISNNFKWLLFGCICCCCTIGLSLCPVIYLNKRSKDAVNQILDLENTRLYHKIGLHWHLTKQKCRNNTVEEYVLMIEFYPPSSLVYPD